MHQGPLRDVRVLEVGGIGPVPFAGMLLADMGADVLRVERPDGPHAALFEGAWDPVLRGRASLSVDLADVGGRDLVLRLAGRADVLIEGHRPGVMERLGLGPEVLLRRRPALVYGRLTGYGQDGPLAGVAGHDVNYLAVAGALGAFARSGQRPLFPLNFVADYGGGAMLLAFGVVSALLEARRSGLGQVIDAAMVDGVALFGAMYHGMRAAGTWGDPPGTNVADSGAHFYEVYATADGRHVAVGAVEPQFYGRLLELLDIAPEEAPQWEVARWPELKDRFAARFAERGAAEWSAILEHEQACASVVLGLADAPDHPHNKARATFTLIDGLVQPSAAPRLGRTPGAARAREPAGVALARWGVAEGDVPRWTSSSQDDSVH